MSGAKSLLEAAEDKVIEQLSDAIRGYNSTAAFSCGGTVPIDIRSTTRYGDFTSAKIPITSPPVTIRWDDQAGDVAGKIQFPVPSGKEDVLEKLVKSCQPATFGFGGGNVLDERIRKAGKLEASEFSTSFNPYDYGIVDAVAQALLPGIARPEGIDKVDNGANAQHWGVVAELYKLNVYSAPSDKFKPHVDTPRGFTQFGSLVVSLPNPHGGGILRVAHKGVERFFDLGSNDSKTSSTIHWAAFYSDCEHEVLPVTSGHRITLTYQLYVSEHLGGVVNPTFPTADPKLYPLYQSLKEMLESPAFMKKGGMLGFHCAHQYAHTNNTANQRLPHALKGIDVVIFTIFRSLGLKTQVRPVLDQEFNEGERDYNDAEFNEEEYEKSSKNLTRALPEFKEIVILGEEAGFEPEDFELAKHWGKYDLFEHVKWLDQGDKKNNEVAMAFQAWCGNEHETGWWYSFAAILVDVPPFSKRNLEEGIKPLPVRERSRSPQSKEA
ncbi:hypothetical protein LSUB1_G003079 [Lachnellula subtilissima]|uniref:Fe2OG dioxygenase domain-containing protein n=1 Tax=Lachnellula subtilissima TaxID=602034 RepID=A0A8H8RP85_9HELO|nr:hypothetical protein LSUB1_G003079 [Lachnellula subtilissima]